MMRMTTLSVAILASSLKTSLTALSCSVFARGGRLHLIDGGDGESDDERTVYDGDAPTDDVSPASGASASPSAPSAHSPASLVEARMPRRAEHSKNKEKSPYTSPPWRAGPGLRTA